MRKASTVFTCDNCSTAVEHTPLGWHKLILTSYNHDYVPAKERQNERDLCSIKCLQEYSQKLQDSNSLGYPTWAYKK